MTLFNKSILVSFLSVFILVSNIVKAEILYSHEGDSIAYDKTNNHYIIRYVGLQDEINEVIWVPLSDVNVKIGADYKAIKNGKIKYKYKLEVDENSKLDLNSFYFYALSADESSIKGPEQWRILFRNTYELNDPEQLISWKTSRMLVMAGEKIEGFELESTALPVYRSAYVRGDTKILTYVDYGPGQETQQYFYEEIAAKDSKGKGINTAIPLIAVSAPFNPVETYTAFHQSILDYIEKSFISTNISTALTDASTAVLASLTANDAKDALSNLKVVKKLVEGEDGDHRNKKGQADDEIGKTQPLIVKELRKILKFNLNFIKKQLKGESEDD